MAEILDLQVDRKRELMGESLKNASSEALEKIARNYWSMPKTERDAEFEVRYFLPKDHRLFRAIGACDVLRERKGEDYVSEIIGVRKPRSLVGKIAYHLFGYMVHKKKEK